LNLTTCSISSPFAIQFVKSMDGKCQPNKVSQDQCGSIFRIGLSLVIASPFVLAVMEAANEEGLQKVDERLEEAENTKGESEITNALKAREKDLTMVGDKVHFLLLHNFTRLHETGLGAIPTSPKACSRKDSLARVNTVSISH